MAQVTTSPWEMVATLSVVVQTGAMIIQTVGLLISLAFIVLQLKQQTRQLKAANIHSLTNLIYPLNLKLAEDRELAKLWIRGPAQISGDAEEIDDYRYGRLMANFFTLYENIYEQHRQGLLDGEIYAAWDKDLDSFLTSLEKSEIAKYWVARDRAYSEGFRELVRGKLNCLPANEGRAELAEPRGLKLS